MRRDRKNISFLLSPHHSLRYPPQPVQIPTAVFEETGGNEACRKVEAAEEGETEKGVKRTADAGRQQLATEDVERMVVLRAALVAYDAVAVLLNINLHKSATNLIATQWLAR